jgi:hypothetical protein
LRFRATALSIGLLSCAGQAPLARVPELPRSQLSARPAEHASTPSAAPVAPTSTNGAATGTSSEGIVPGSLPAVSLGDIGGPGELRLMASSSSGAWVALCSAGAATPTLVLGSGSGEPIDELLAQDANGRYLVVVQGGSVQLVDAVGGARVSLSELGADVRRVRADYAEHRTLSFDASGRWLAYLRRQGNERLIVVRELATGAERTFAAGAGDVYRLALSADARYVVFEALREDTNRNGKLDWPLPEDSAGTKACEPAALPKFRSFGYQGRGDALTRALVSLDDGSVRDVPELVTPLGRSLLVRESDGSLKLEQKGKRTALAPASCAGRVLFADAERELVLAACAPPPPPPKKGKSLPAAAPSGKRQVWLFGAGFAKDLESELYETSTDREALIGTRLVPLYPGSSAALVDLDRRELLPLTAGSRVVTTRGAQALLWRDSDLLRYDAQTKAEQKLAHGVSKNPDLLQVGGAVLLSPFVVVDLQGPAGASPPRALALSAGGFVLTAASATETVPHGAAIRGPLHWVDARLPPPDGPPR